ncbi:AAA family ATPase [Streptomyces sp. NPDC059443]|uniref:AAA family ATPase n=1 Tax=unclassified Streptomyces TaxID=2593676 RepID=UPI00367D57E3
MWGRGLADVEPTSDSEAAFEAVTGWVHALADQQERDEQRVCLDWANYGRGICLSGPPGTLKTTIAAAALYDIKKRDDVVVGFVRFPALLEARRGRYQDRGKPRSNNPDFVDHEANEIKELLEAVRLADVLLLDDVGSEREVRDSGFAAEVLDETLRHRFDAGRPTIVTTNLRDSEWAGRYDEATASFIHQAFREYLVLGGPDLRAES